jgi:intracellular septation protein A
MSQDTAAEQIGLRSAFARALDRSGGGRGLVLTAAPTLAFVVANAVDGLTSAFVALGVTAAAVFAYRTVRREPLRGAVVGLVVAAVCAAIAAWTGEARGFFLLPTLLPGFLLLVFLGSVLTRRPLTGTFFNRLVGGPAQWRSDREFLRLYSVTTMVGVLVHAVNLTARIVLYRADEPAVLAAITIGTTPVFALLFAVTIVLGRRAVLRRR